jgi:hypothetical protein
MERWFMGGLIVGFILLLYETKGKLLGADGGGWLPIGTVGDNTPGGSPGVVPGSPGSGTSKSGCGCGGSSASTMIHYPPTLYPPLQAPTVVRAPARYIQAADTGIVHPPPENPFNYPIPILFR